MGSKTLHPQNPPVVNWSSRLSQVDLYNGREKVVDVVVVIANKIAASVFTSECRQTCAWSHPAAAAAAGGDGGDVSDAAAETDARRR